MENYGKSDELDTHINRTVGIIEAPSHLGQVHGVHKFSQELVVHVDVRIVPTLHLAGMFQLDVEMIVRILIVSEDVFPGLNLGGTVQIATDINIGHLHLLEDFLDESIPQAKGIHLGLNTDFVLMDSPGWGLLQYKIVGLELDFRSILPLFGSQGFSAGDLWTIMAESTVSTALAGWTGASWCPTATMRSFH